MPRSRIDLRHILPAALRGTEFEQRLNRPVWTRDAMEELEREFDELVAALEG